MVVGVVLGVGVWVGVGVRREVEEGIGVWVRVLGLLGERFRCVGEKYILPISFLQRPKPSMFILCLCYILYKTLETILSFCIGARKILKCFGLHKFLVFVCR